MSRRNTTSHSHDAHDSWKLLQTREEKWMHRFANKPTWSHLVCQHPLLGLIFSDPSVFTDEGPQIPSLTASVITPCQPVWPGSDYMHFSLKHSDNLSCIANFLFFSSKHLCFEKARNTFSRSWKNRNKSFLRKFTPSIKQLIPVRCQSEWDDTTFAYK